MANEGEEDWTMLEEQPEATDLDLCVADLEILEAYEDDRMKTVLSFFGSFGKKYYVYNTLDDFRKLVIEFPKIWAKDLISSRRHKTVNPLLYTDTAPEWVNFIAIKKDLEKNGKSAQWAYFYEPLKNLFFNIMKGTEIKVPFAQVCSATSPSKINEMINATDLDIFVEETTKAAGERSDMDFKQKFEAFKRTIKKGGRKTMKKTKKSSKKTSKKTLKKTTKSNKTTKKSSKKSIKKTSKKTTKSKKTLMKTMKSKKSRKNRKQLAA